MSGRGLGAIVCAAVAALGAPGCQLIIDPDEVSRGCGENDKECAGQCVSRTDPRFGCAARTCQPCALPNATSACSPEGGCFVASCLGTFDDCNKQATDGCEVNTDTDPDHCGGCSAEPCEVAGALPACAGGQCAIRKCLAGYKDCNRESFDGCESVVARDRDHCGRCNHGCDAGRRCMAGQCVAGQCVAGQCVAGQCVAGQCDAGAQP